MARASATVLPLTHSVASDELAMAEPQPKVLNFASSMTWVSGFTWKLFYSGGAYHPCAEGMKAVADILYKRLVDLGIVEDGEL